MQIAGDGVLWWIMVVTGCAAAALSLWSSALRRRRAGEAAAVQSHRLDMASYALLSVSVLSFVARGLILPQ